MPASTPGANLIKGRNNAYPLMYSWVGFIYITFPWKYNLIDRENYCDLFYYTHTIQTHRLKANMKFVRKTDQAPM